LEMFRNKKRAFTLVELLVVIAIIALLMAILVPALNRARKQARSAACKMNLHQWSLIWSLYCEDNDGHFCQAGPLGWKRGTWIIALRYEWRTKTNILRCPMAVNRRPDGKAWGGPLHTYVMGSGGYKDLREECSYGANNWLYDCAPGVTSIQGRPTAYNWKTVYVRHGNGIPVFADTMWRGGGPSEAGLRGDPPEYDGQWAGYNAEMKHFCINRHDGYVNHLFLDWSVRAVGLKELWTLKWHRQFDTGGIWTRIGGVKPLDWPKWMRHFKDY